MVLSIAFDKRLQRFCILSHFWIDQLVDIILCIVGFATLFLCFFFKILWYSDQDWVDGLDFAKLYYVFCLWCVRLLIWRFIHGLWVFVFAVLDGILSRHRWQIFLNLDHSVSTGVSVVLLLKKFIIKVRYSLVNGIFIDFMPNFVWSCTNLWLNADKWLNKYNFSGLQDKIKDGILVINKSSIFVRRVVKSPSGLSHCLLGSL